MKKLLLAAFLVASFSVHAEDEKLCRIYEFNELNSYSDADLDKLYQKYSEINTTLNNSPFPIDARDLHQRFEDKRNCSGETERIGKIIESHKQLSAEKAEKKVTKVKKSKKTNTEG